MDCPECNCFVKHFDKWCIECGVSLSEQFTCENCTNYLRQQSSYCHHCGHRSELTQEQALLEATVQLDDIHSGQTTTSESLESDGLEPNQLEEEDIEEQNTYDLLADQETNYQSGIWLPRDYGLYETDDEMEDDEPDPLCQSDVEQIEDGNAEKFYTRGLWYAKLGEHLLAIDDFSSAILINPDAATYFINRGDSERTVGNYQNAIQDYGQVLSLAPDVPEALWGRGQAYSEIAERALAMKDFMAASSLRPDWEVALRSLGYSYSHAGHHTAAIREYQKCLGLHSANNMASEKTSDTPPPSQQEDDLEQLISEMWSNKNDAETNFYIGLNLVAGSRYRDAIKDFSRSINFNPYHVDAFFNRGLAFDALNEHDKALIDLKVALSLEPSYAPLVSTLGSEYITLAEAHQDDESPMIVRLRGTIETMTGIIRLDPSRKEKRTIDALYSRGFLYLENTDLDMAFGDLEEAILSLKYASANLYHALGLYWAKAGSNLRSTEAFATAIRLDYRFRYLLLREAWYQRLTCWDRVATNTYFDKHPLLNVNANFSPSTYSPELQPTLPLDLGAPDLGAPDAGVSHFPIIDPSGGSENRVDEDLSDVWLTHRVDGLFSLRSLSEMDPGFGTTGLQFAGVGEQVLFNSDRARDLLCMGTDVPNARFREGQEEVIAHVVEGRGRLLVVQRTGWGKSFVYFIATKLMREAGRGPTLLVSPLISLMRNQVLVANRMGVHSATINSENKDEWTEITAAFKANQLDLLLVSPEKLADHQFRQEVLASITLSMLVIDEAHCISDWGHDFRPEYWDLKGIVSHLPSNFPLLATTATANDRVVRDLQETLGPNLSISRGDLNRPSLSLQTINLPRKSERLAWLADRLSEIRGNGIIYTLTINDAHQVAEWLVSRGIQVESYTGRTENRERLEHALLNNQIKALVATSSLGMGFDKSDLSFVFHYQTPGSPVTYYQQVGRAGRGTVSAYGVLLNGEEDTEITDYFIENASPDRSEVQNLLDAFERFPEGASIYQLMANVNHSKARIENAIKHMVQDSSAPVVEIKKGNWQLTASTLSEEFWQRIDRRIEIRRFEQQQMQEYANLEAGHIEFLVGALDGDPSTISTSTLPKLETDIASRTLRSAEEFLRRTKFDIPPHKQWPRSGGMPLYGLKGNIKKEHQAQVGKALCLWRNAGWGELVFRGKHVDGHFSDQLVEACTELVRNWNPQPFPSWVTSIPSSTSQSLVSGFARRLASTLNLPYEDTLRKDTSLGRPQQKEMANNTMQARNLDASLEVCSVIQHAGSGLLVDDMVNSAWTFTVAAWLLRKHGAGDVFPLALATSGKTRYGENN